MRVLSLLLVSLSVLVLCGCALLRSEQVAKIALLAPFEGRYREVGYNALYAARLALADATSTHIDLLPLDDGGSNARAAERLRALQYDPAIALVLGLGLPATSAEAQAASGNLPLLIVGHWGAQPTQPNVYLLASPDLNAPRLSVIAAAAQPVPFICGEVCALMQFPALRADLDGIQVVSSGTLPDATFRERYVASAEFAPEPGLLATLTYDAMRFALQAIQTDVALEAMVYDGINGPLALADGYWQGAPTNTFAYVDGVLSVSSANP